MSSSTPSPRPKLTLNSHREVEAEESTQARIAHLVEAENTGLTNERTRLAKAQEIVAQIEARLSNHQHRLELATRWLTLSTEQTSVTQALAEHHCEQARLQTEINQASQERAGLVAWLANPASTLTSIAPAPAELPPAEFGTTWLESQMELEASPTEEAAGAVEITPSQLDIIIADKAIGWSDLVEEAEAGETEAATELLKNEAEVEVEEAAPEPLAFSPDDFEVDEADFGFEADEAEEATMEKEKIEAVEVAPKVPDFTEAATPFISQLQAPPPPSHKGSPPPLPLALARPNKAKARLRPAALVTSNSNSNSKATRLGQGRTPDQLLPTNRTSKRSAALLAGD